MTAKQLHIPTGSTLVLSSRNPGKVRELQAMLQGRSVKVIGLPQLETMIDLKAGTLGDAIESGLTYAENAIIKVDEIVAAIQKSKLADKERYFAIADDSGMELEGISWKHGKNKLAGEDDALAGLPFPGVHTRRFRTAQKGTEAERYAAMYKFYDQVSLPGRRLKSTTVLAVKRAVEDLAAPCVTFTGELGGTLAYPPRGEMGFGYDPVFRPDGHDKTLAEMLPEEKNRISQRKKAFNQLVESIPAENEKQWR